MREIKFRMWDLENKAMIDGDSLAFEEYAPISHLLTQEGIMQYTGLKDKSGKGIYEGDVLRVGLKGMIGAEYYNMIVEFDSSRVRFVLREDEETASGFTSDNDLEVIGNIYEHPHLLETPKAIELNESPSGAEADHDPT